MRSGTRRTARSLRSWLAARSSSTASIPTISTPATCSAQPRGQSSSQPRTYGASATRIHSHAGPSKVPHRAISNPPNGTGSTPRPGSKTRSTKPPRTPLDTTITDSTYTKPAYPRSPVCGPATAVEHYELHDYLLQHHLTAHRHTPTTTDLWNTVTAANNLTRLNPHVAAALAENAELRGLYAEAESLLTHAADNGDVEAESRLTDLLLLRGDEETVRTRAENGDGAAQTWVVVQLVERGDEDGLRARADNRDKLARSQLNLLLARRGEEEGLRGLADSGGLPFPALSGDIFDNEVELKGLFDELGYQKILARCTSADLLTEPGGDEGLRARADNGDFVARLKLTLFVAARDGLRALQALADGGDWLAKYCLPDLLAMRGDEEALRALADGGDWHARFTLTELMASRGDEAGLRAIADEGDWFAKAALADLLLERGDEEGLRARADKGDRSAQGRLADLLLLHGDVEGLGARADKGESSASYLLSDLLVERGDAYSLKARADDGDRFAQFRVAAVLRIGGPVEELRYLVHACYGGAAKALISLYQQDRPDGSHLELDVNAEPRPNR
jgi:hypothetical protein